MTWVLYVDVAVGLALAVGLLTASVIAGREPVVHPVVWALGLGFLVLRALFSLSIGIGVLVSTDATWAFAIGALALALIIPSAVLRPRWAGIVLLVTAVVQPALLFVLGRLSGLAEQEFPVEAMLGFYSLTVAIIGGVLIAATLGHRKGQSVPDSLGENAHPVSESAQRTVSTGTESGVSGS